MCNVLEVSLDELLCDSLNTGSKDIAKGLYERIGKLPVGQASVVEQVVQSLIDGFNKLSLKE